MEEQVLELDTKDITVGENTPPPIPELPKVDEKVVVKKQTLGGIIRDAIDGVKKAYHYEYDPYKWADKGYCQLNHQTRKNRFPKIYDAAKNLRPDAKRVLSFGCSTGEEVEALAERFPDAELVGMDIDIYSIKTARRNNKRTNVFFHDSLGATGKYDVITCLQVLFSLEKPLPKDRWESAIREIDAHLNDNGVVLIYTSEFDPAEILTADKYEPLNVWMREHNKKKGSQYFNGYYRKKVAQ